MRVISNKSLREFVALHPDAGLPLQVWRKLMEHASPRSYSDLKKLSNSVDRVGNYFVFDIVGNKYRVIAALHFDRQMLYVRHVFTHVEYDRWRP
jgi:mRNA interferase HigB